MEEKIITEICTEVTKISKDVYQDTFQPAAKQIGKTLETVCELANTILLPVMIANTHLGYKAQEFISDLENKTKKIPKNKLIEPSLRIAGPVIEGLKYTIDLDLREMFLNLLVASMNIDTETYTHPSFVETIKQLSPLDAKVFNIIVMNKLVACAYLQLMIQGTNKVYIEAFPTFFVEELYLLADPFLISASIKNLIRLGLIEHMDKDIMGYNYDRLTTCTYVKEIKKLYEKNGKTTNVSIIKQALRINDYGNNFAEICLSY